MTAVAEGSVDLVTKGEEKSGSDLSSYQDLSKSEFSGIGNSDQVNNLDDSYEFVSGVDGVGDNSVDNEGVSAAEDSIVENKAAVEVPKEDSDVASDVVDVEVTDSLKRAENGDTEADSSTVDGIPPESDESCEDRCESEAAADGVPEEKTDEQSECRLGAEIPEAGGFDDKLDPGPGAEIEMAGDQETKGEGSEADKVQETIESNPSTLEDLETQGEDLGLVIDSEEKKQLDNLSKFEDEAEKEILGVHEAEKEILGDHEAILRDNHTTSELWTQKVEGKVKLESNPAAIVNLEIQVGDRADKEIVGDDDTTTNKGENVEGVVKLESLSTIESMKTQTQIGEPELVTESEEIGQSDDPSSHHEGAKIEMVEDHDMISEGLAGNQGTDLGTPGGLAGDQGTDLGPYVVVASEVEPQLLEAGTNEPDADDADETASKTLSYALQCRSEGASPENQIKESLQREVVEREGHEVPISMSVDSDLESFATNDKGAVEDTGESDESSAINDKGSVKDSGESDEAADVNEDKNELFSNETSGVVQDANTEGEDETMLSKVAEPAEREVPQSHEEEATAILGKTSMGSVGISDHLEEIEEHGAGDDDLPAQSLTASSDNENIHTASSIPANGPTQSLFEYDPPVHENNSSVPFTKKVSTCEDDDLPVASEILSENMPTSTVSEGHTSPASSNTDMTSGVTVTFTKELLDSLDVKNEGAFHIKFGTTDLKDIAAQSNGTNGSCSDDNELLKEDEEIGNSQNDSTSSIDDIVGEVTNTNGVTKPFNFLIRIPRSNNESLKEKVRLAKELVDEQTKVRDAIQVQIQEKRRANSQSNGVEYENAKNEVRSARKLLRSKRIEIDSLQSMITKAKNAISVDDIDSRIHDMEHMIQHETMPLKEEKQLIREIKQLKQFREQLSSNMGSKDELKQSLEQKDTLEERLKVLRKELDVLKKNIDKAEAAIAEAERKYDDENKKIKELQDRFRATNDVRQEAYVQWQTLRKELTDKNKRFFQYKDDAGYAHEYARGRDWEGLYRHCKYQVENFMQLWNTNGEFRQEYVSLNTRSTIRRLGTLDGRSLGPDEQRLNLPSYADERANRMVSTPANVVSVSQAPVQELQQEVTFENQASEDKSTKKVNPNKNQTAKTVEAAPKSLLRNGSTTPDKDVPEEVPEEPVKSKEEIELTRKTEEKRRKEAEAQLQEQRRLEELAKANEARERKKKQAEKEQRRAQLKAQKEAEQREKERQKRLKKKERKTAAAPEINNSDIADPVSSSESAIETSKEVDTREETSSTAKKTTKPSVFKKQVKTKSTIPPPLRNRGRKKWQQYMWIGAASVLVIIVVCLANLGVFPKTSLTGGGFS